MYSTLALGKEREIVKEETCSLKKGERSSMLLCTCRHVHVRDCLIIAKSCYTLYMGVGVVVFCI